MLTEYEQYMLPADADSQVDTTCVQDASYPMYRDISFLGQPEDCRWTVQDGVDAEPTESYTLTVLSDGSQLNPLPPMYHPDDTIPSWEQHGVYHLEDDCAVSGSDGTCADRNCVKSLLRVALQKGGPFAQQYTSCGIPQYPQLPVDTPQFVSSTSPSPRPLTPVGMAEYSPLMAEEPVSTTTGYSPYYPVTPTTPSSPYTPFRTPYPTPSPDAYPPPYHQTQLPPYQNTIVPLPVHMLPTMSTPTSTFPQPATPPSTPTSTTRKRRRNRISQNASGAPPRKRERPERQLHPCTLCDKRFKDNYSVNVHMRTHTGEKPFPCVVCGKMFRQKAHLAKHRSTHQASEYAAVTALPDSVLEVDDSGNVNSSASDLLPWTSVGLESKCKVSTVWTPGVMSHPLTTMP